MEEAGWADLVCAECADGLAGGAVFIKMEFNSPEEAFRKMKPL